MVCIVNYDPMKEQAKSQDAQLGVESPTEL